MHLVGLVQHVLFIGHMERVHKKHMFLQFHLINLAKWRIKFETKNYNVYKNKGSSTDSCLLISLVQGSKPFMKCRNKPNKEDKI